MHDAPRGLVFACLFLLSACGSRAVHSENNESPSGQPVPLALPPLSLPNLPAPTATSSTCEFGAPIPLVSGTARVLGVWRDPSRNTVHVARSTERNQFTIGTLALDTGNITDTNHITLPERAEPQAAWRSAAGTPLVVWRSGRTLHLAQVLNNATTNDVYLYRYDPGYYETTYQDQLIEPIDDPSSSSLAGLVLGGPTTASAQRILCITNTLRFTSERCQYNWAGAMVRRSGLARTTSPSLVAVFRSYSTTPAEVLVSSNTYSWQTLGRGPAAGTATRYSYGGNRGNRTARADGARGGPFFLSHTNGAVALWVDESSSLVAQPTNAEGVASVDPVPLPFIDPYLEDGAVNAGEVLVTLSTRADRNDAQGTTSLVRLHPQVPTANPVVAAPQRLSLPNARILPLHDQRVLFWSPRSGRAILATCGTTT